MPSQKMSALSLNDTKAGKQELVKCACCNGTGMVVAGSRYAVATTFPKFSKLPEKLRKTILEVAAADYEYVGLRPRSGSPFVIASPMRCPLPMVNHELRKMFLVSHQSFYATRFPHSKIYLNPSNDAIFLDKNISWRSFKDGIFNQVETLAITSDVWFLNRDRGSEPEYAFSDYNILASNISLIIIVLNKRTLGKFEQPVFQDVSATIRETLKLIRIPNSGHLKQNWTWEEAAADEKNRFEKRVPDKENLKETNRCVTLEKKFGEIEKWTVPEVMFVEVINGSDGKR
ncbi:hypothetical protein B0J14DRAFT_595939 [Halenospora varia]|nr:hypothetical protein B0J14DRAFT_595939 [Halenospora varia]